jgi:very-short-patch-repair endonuclease
MKLPFITQCKIHGLPTPELEYKFLPGRKFKVDYYFPSFRLAVEQEGAVWTQGRHNHPTGFLKDKEKYNLLAIEGISLLRFTPTEMLDGTAIKAIIEFVARQGVI